MRRSMLAAWPALLVAVLTGCGSVAPAGTVAQPRLAAARHRLVTAARSPAAAGRPRRSAAHAARCDNRPPPEPAHPIDHREWISGVAITEYYPAPERWADGRRVRAPGLPGDYAVDWLYGVHGLPMEGDGIDRGGHLVHVADLGSTGWVNADGRPTVPVCLGQWSHGAPVWLKGGWRNAAGKVTYPLAAGGWSNGRPVGAVRGYGGIDFAPGPSLPLRPYHSIAVDPRLIPEGSHVYIPAYKPINGGWFVAQDTGGAIKGRHIDVYRMPPASSTDYGRYLTAQRVLVVPPR